MVQENKYFQGLNNSLSNWSGNNKFLQKVTFPPSPGDIPRMYYDLYTGKSTESKLVFLKEYRVGINETCSQHSSRQAQFHWLLFIALSEKHTCFDWLNTNYTGAIEQHYKLLLVVISLATVQSEIPTMEARRSVPPI